MKKSYYVTRNKFGNLHVFSDEPCRVGSIFCRRNMDKGFIAIPPEYSELFYDVTWDNSPKKIIVEVW